MVADGAMGTMLFARGLKSGECPERVNLESPDWLVEISRLYYEAGAEIIQTNTFGASPLKLAMYHLDDKTEEINASAIRAARKGSNGKTFISASCGPCGRLLTPYGDVSPEEVAQSFKRQIKAIMSEGVDLINIETMTDLSEARLAISAARNAAPAVPICASMTFDFTPRGFFTIMGNSVKQAVEGLSEAGADIIGSNCGNGIQNMIGIAAEFRKYSSLPISIRSNAGLPQIRGEQLIYPESPEYMAEKCDELLKLGVSIIGGCCGTTPAHIAAIRKAVSQRLETNGLASKEI